MESGALEEDFQVYILGSTAILNGLLIIQPTLATAVDVVLVFDLL